MAIDQELAVAPLALNSLIIFAHIGPQKPPRVGLCPLLLGLSLELRFSGKHNLQATEPTAHFGEDSHLSPSWELRGLLKDRYGLQLLSGGSRER